MKSNESKLTKKYIETMKEILSNTNITCILLSYQRYLIYSDNLFFRKIQPNLFILAFL